MTSLIDSTASWPQTEATVESSTQHHCDLASAGGYVGQEYSITFRYQVAGHEYTGEFECSRSWDVGSRFCLRYNPSDPATNTMCDRRGDRWVYYLLAIVAILAFIAYFWIRHARLGY